MCTRRIIFGLMLALCLAGSAAAQVQLPPIGRVIVRIREAGGANISTPAWVRLYSDISMFQLSSGTQNNSQVVFDNVPLGEYHIEVRAPGYLQAVNDATLLTPNAIAYVWVELRLERGPNSPAGDASRAGPPVMAPKARKDFQQAAAALRANDLKLAQECLDRAKKLAPGHPDVHYLQGVIYFQQQDTAAARKALETAISLFPAHSGALSTLGAVLYRQGNFAEAVTVLDKSVELSPQSWQSHRTLAMCQIRLRAYDKARTQAERAIETAGDNAPELHVLLARILIALKEREKARTELQSFITANPGHPEVADAQRLLAALLNEMKPANTGKPETGPGPSAGNAAANEPALLDVAVITAMPKTRTGPGRWAPPAVDETPPVLLNNTSCNLPEVLAGTGKRALALAANLEQVTATEKVEQSELDEEGDQVQVRTNTFDYLVSIIETRPGNLSVEENRIPISRSATPPRYMTNGLGALALIFHPYYARDYEMHCEGLTEMNGQAAWAVYFQQRADVPSRIRSYTIQEGSFNVALKGRAWIAANNFQVLKLETDLVGPMKRLRLEQEHLVIEYQPVDFKSRKIRLWLPANAEMYAFFRGHRFLHHHSFTGYKVFSVDTSVKTFEEKKP